eukprot:TRINITY_DN19692_c0_g1_i1.p1 TRINITY_DN19692_c0_g1~~TRINITY_DN19692_c0_g1_i1.p1  ORF type:complete len:357 (+),score=81.56 TRINITY_DN19692_c0_g1_i1:83-1153(+)
MTVDPLRVNVFGDVCRLAGLDSVSDINAAVRNITADQLEEVRTLRNPPDVVRWTLEATFLILEASKTSAAPSVPAWDSVQRLLKREGFVQKVLDYDMDLLRGKPELASFIARTYFRGEAPAAASKGCARRPSKVCIQPLTVERVRRANLATAALFQWSVIALVSAGIPVEVEEDEPGESSSEETAAPAEQAVEEILPASEVDESDAAVEPLSADPQPAPNDRHFEDSVEFQVWKDAVTSGHERTLSKFVEAVNMQKSLRLRLLGCVNDVESTSVARGRLKQVQQWFIRRGISCTSEVGDKFMSSRCPTGVFCQLHLDDDPELREHFRGDLEPSSETTERSRECAELLQRRFMTCMH